jgi:hypothetical protein
MEVEWTVCVFKNLMEPGAADPESLGNSSERQFVPGNPISKIANAAFWGKTQIRMVRKFPEIRVDAPDCDLWENQAASSATHAQCVNELFVSILVFFRRRP